ncbi:C6 transcription factor, putative [Talaromyces stipitatus ATCC 10500]|uniref:C6 transcription factor, putative n=1 Tax=Talaromyces stipitatus (strain ATCC 10500 / CBS 375.48 / QM 6759 / NRRL 1006) TaxID=441959 RepID=B8M6W4_TALSN|nr:C6 transcription factor, putative [Talaromyces stipitatus ATCC 10500]EED20184.1 C6 transcription factor, putative [Talaromyces stipitatus ATCC 10500]
MFLTFESSQANKTGLRNPKKQISPTSITTRRSERLNRRRTTPRACTSCRQRKIRCDGEKPCEACRWYKKAELCSYPERERGMGRERNSQEEPAHSSSDYRKALERLFPETAPENIVHLSREKLLGLISKSSAAGSQHHDSMTIATSASVETRHSTLSIERPAGLESLHSIPGEQQKRIHLDDETQCIDGSEEESIEHISDDVNALSLPARNLTSYLGVSSIQAALKVIAWLHPELDSHLSRLSSKDQRRQHHRHQEQPGVLPTEEQMLDAYFTNFQSFAPLIDEDTIRSTFLSNRRKDDKWLALLNIIFALGSITAAGVDNHNHRTYYERSKSYLNINTLGNPSLEVVQTLGLMGGWYCHYISQPNLAYALMGASLRMAVTLGLQREPPLDRNLPVIGTGYQEFKRRVWWSLCCLETWGHETLGRPSMDFFSPSITVNLPRVLDKENYIKILPLIENVHFIRLASKIQDSLAALPTKTYSEMLTLDSQLVAWWNNLPPVLKDCSPCPESIWPVRTVMRWRFYNQRILLYRPSLLNYAMRQIPFVAVRDEERVVVQRCCEIAKMAIEDISGTTTSTIGMNQMIAWNAVWLVFQATMVPLIFLSTCSTAAAATQDDGEVESCKVQVQTAISTLDRMRVYGHTAERSLEMISAILDTVLGISTVRAYNSAGLNENIESQNLPPMTEHQPITRDRVLDWTAAATTSSSFDNFSSQHMWEYLSWGESNDLWPELYTNLDPQDSQIEGADFFNSN